MKRIDWGKLVGAIALSEAAGGLGAIFTTPQISTWYQTLVKPEWNPPAWIFAPVWTLLFLLMGIALYRVWRTGLKQQAEREAFWLFLAHLLVNIAWSIVFFGLRNPGLGLIVILILLGYILVLVKRFGAIDRWAGRLLVPYAAWVSFATVLNAAIWSLNS